MSKAGRVSFGVLKMRWITHQIAAVGLLFSLKFSLGAVAAGFVGSILPDIIDQKLAKTFGFSKRGQQRVFGRVHRGLSHWFGLYLLLILACNYLLIADWIKEIILGFAIAALSHVLLDMLTPKGVPILPLAKKPRLSLPICSTGSLGEYIFLMAICLIYVIYMRDECLHYLNLARKFLNQI